MHNFSYVATSKTKTSRYVFLGLVGSAAIFIVASYITPAFSGLVWMGAFVFIVAAIYVYTKYVGASYCYEIVDSGVPSFVVTMTVGKTAKTMARIDVDSVVELRRMTRSEYRAYKCEKGVSRYSYFPTMMPAELYLVSMRSTYENADLFIEVDEQFAAALLERFGANY